VLVADVAAAEAGLGWQTDHSRLHDIVTDAWTWHRAHPNGYERA
jgi:UDP-glucose 4-epimerase